MRRFEYRDDPHEYRLDGVLLPSLTGMLTADGLSAHLASVAPDVLQAKAAWGTRLHLALQKAEYGFGVEEEFKEHCTAWLDACRRLKWLPAKEPIWKNCEIPSLAVMDGFVYGFTPDRAHPEAVVEIKGTYAPQVSHGIQTALETIGMGYPEDTPRYVAYFDRNGMKKLHRCGATVKRDGQELDVFAEANRIIFEHGLVWEGKPVKPGTAYTLEEK